MIDGEEIDRVNASSYYFPLATYTHSYCLDYDTCYLFKIFDISADGMGFSGTGTTDMPAYYEAYLGSERLFRKEGAWGKKKIHKFCTPSGDRIDSYLNFERLGNKTDSYYDFEEDGFPNRE